MDMGVCRVRECQCEYRDATQVVVMGKDMGEGRTGTPRPRAVTEAPGRRAAPERDGS